MCFSFILSVRNDQKKKKESNLIWLEQIKGEKGIYWKKQKQKKGFIGSCNQKVHEQLGSGEAESRAQARPEGPTLSPSQAHCPLRALSGSVVRWAHSAQLPPPPPWVQSHTLAAPQAAERHTSSRLSGRSARNQGRSRAHPRMDPSGRGHGCFEGLRPGPTPSPSSRGDESPAEIQVVP